MYSFSSAWVYAFLYYDYQYFVNKKVEKIEKKILEGLPL
jgi:hypothetical protein